MATFKDHFSHQSPGYSRYRPSYPHSLFAQLAQLTPCHEKVWDCATGNGQAALALTEFFSSVFATDASQQQLAQAPQHPQITYRCMPAEATDFPSQNFDLITVAQALHWFSFEDFYREARRVLKPKGILAAWAYGLLQCEDPHVEEALHHFYHHVMWQGNYWPPERAHIDSCYRDIPFPLQELPAPAVSLCIQWNRQEFMEYLRTWSGVQNYIRIQGEDPIERHVRPALSQCWKATEKKKRFFTSLLCRVGRFGPLNIN